MGEMRQPTFLGLRSRAAQRGSLVVAAFVIILGLMVMVAGINTMLQEQIRQSTTIKGISLAKLQAYYLAEMGINEIMSQANQAPASAFPLASGTGQTLDLKSHVAMVRSDPAGVASCTLTRTTGASLPAYQVVATLTTPDGTFNKTIYFDVARPNTQWVLTRYLVP